MKKLQAFISYRRDTGRETARNIYEKLTMKGINTFFDYSSMREGKFNQQIYEAIEQADDFILILSKNALDRCIFSDDWVRIEIEHALKHNKNIILVNVEKEIEFPDNLPETLIELPNYHAMTLSQEYYEESIAKLIKMLTSKHSQLFISRIFEKINKGSILSKLIIYLIIILIGSAIVYWCLESQKDIAVHKNSLVAKLYLPRYPDLDREVLSSHWFTHHDQGDFEYIDTIIGNEYYIYPRSRYLTDQSHKSLQVLDNYTPFYHNLPLRLSVQNTKSSTKKIIKAEFEIMEIHPITDPIITIKALPNSLKFISQVEDYMPKYELDYSLLAPGESLTSYKMRENVTSGNYVVSPGESNSIQGKISFNKNQWKFNYLFQHPDSLPLNEETANIKVSPASSNVGVYYVDIKSFEMPFLYSIEEIQRKLVNGEVDDDMYIIVSSNFSFDAKVRVKLQMLTNEIVYTEPINVRYIKPNLYENYPF